MKDLKLFEEDQVNPQNMEYLGKLIAFCKENDIEFVAVTTPIPINTLKAYSDNFKAFSHDLKDYTDYDGHMNGNAASEYSKVLANILKGEGV